MSVPPSLRMSMRATPDVSSEDALNVQLADVTETEAGPELTPAAFGGVLSMPKEKVAMPVGPSTSIDTSSSSSSQAPSGYPEISRTPLIKPTSPRTIAASSSW